MVEGSVYMRRRSSLSGASMGMGQVAVTNNRLYDNALAVQRKHDLKRIARWALTNPAGASSNLKASDIPEGSYLLVPCLHPCVRKRLSPHGTQDAEDTEIGKRLRWY